MAEKMNKFLKQLEKNNTVKTSTDEIVEMLYDEPKTVEKKSSERKTVNKTSPRKPAEIMKKNVGRPKTRTEENYLQIHLILPESLKKKVQKAIICRRTNMNSYLLDLINKDLKENGSNYENLYESLKKLDS